MGPWFDANGILASDFTVFVCFCHLFALSNTLQDVTEDFREAEHYYLHGIFAVPLVTFWQSLGLQLSLVRSRQPKR